MTAERKQGAERNGEKSSEADYKIGGLVDVWA